MVSKIKNFCETILHTAIRQQNGANRLAQWSGDSLFLFFIQLRVDYFSKLFKLFFITLKGCTIQLIMPEHF